MYPGIYPKTSDGLLGSQVQRQEEYPDRGMRHWRGESCYRQPSARLVLRVKRNCYKRLAKVSSEVEHVTMFMVTIRGSLCKP